MKKIILILVGLLIAQFAQAQNITEGNNKFAMNLLQVIANGTENTFFSPYSVSTALFMTAGGAKAQTEKQMLQVLNQSENTSAYHSKFGQHIALVEKKSKIQLNIANAIWMQKGFTFQKNYLELLNKAYKAKLNESDFKVNPDAEAKKINKWVEGKTKNKIKDLIKQGVLKSNTKMILVNAIYFYGGWHTEFNKKSTKKGDFYLDNNTKQSTDFMHAKYKMKYATDNKFELLSIPYMNDEASMLIFLPKAKGNFKDALASLDYKKYTTLVNQLAVNEVNLAMPKFSMTAEFELGETLSKIGMPLAFTDNADFSGMTGKDDLKIDKVIHKAFIDVSEEGTEAAAATAVVMVRKSASFDSDIINFVANHPFIYMIRDNATGQILFAGVLNKPTTKQ